MIIIKAKKRNQLEYTAPCHIEIACNASASTCYFMHNYVNSHSFVYTKCITLASHVCLHRVEVPSKFDVRNIRCLSFKIDTCTLLTSLQLPYCYVPAVVPSFACMFVLVVSGWVCGRPESKFDSLGCAA